jgi:hypothetical protein
MKTLYIVAVLAKMKEIWCYVNVVLNGTINAALGIIFKIVNSSFVVNVEVFMILKGESLMRCVLIREKFWN